MSCAANWALKLWLSQDKTTIQWHVVGRESRDQTCVLANSVLLLDDILSPKPDTLEVAVCGEISKEDYSTPKHRF